MKTSGGGRMPYLRQRSLVAVVGIVDNCGDDVDGNEDNNQRRLRFS